MNANLEFNYVVVNRDGKDFVVRVLEEPTYKKVDLDPAEAYIPVTIPNGMEKRDYPGIFDNTATIEDEYPTPFRKVMCRINVCDFCNKTVGSDGIEQEFTDIDDRMGYFYCTDCNDRFVECLQRTGTRSIWYLRERNMNEPRYNIWVPRTRRDEMGKRVKNGLYTFEKWRICGWYAYNIQDEHGILFSQDSI